MLSQLLQNIQNTQNLIDEIEEMLLITQLEHGDKVQAEMTVVILDKERAEMTAKAHTLKNLMLFRETKLAGEVKH